MAKQMLLFLPIEEQAEFADETCIHFSANDDYCRHALLRAQAYGGDDVRTEEEGDWVSQQLGNLAYMTLYGPERYRAQWRECHERFVFEKTVRFNRDGGAEAVARSASSSSSALEGL